MDEIMQAKAISTEQYALAHQVQPPSIVVDTIEGAAMGAYVGWLFAPLFRMLGRLFGRL